jgi:prophage regulatory protein
MRTKKTPIVARGTFYQGGNMKILNLKEVIEKVGLSTTTIWRLERRGEFPKRIKLSPNRRGWEDTQVQEWVDTRPRGIEGEVAK